MRYYVTNYISDIYERRTIAPGADGEYAEISTISVEPGQDIGGESQQRTSNTTQRGRLEQNPRTEEWSPNGHHRDPAFVTYSNLLHGHSQT